MPSDAGNWISQRRRRIRLKFGVVEGIIEQIDKNIKLKNSFYHQVKEQNSLIQGRKEKDESLIFLWPHGIPKESDRSKIKSTPLDSSQIREQ